MDEKAMDWIPRRELEEWEDEGPKGGRENSTVARMGENTRLVTVETISMVILRHHEILRSRRTQLGQVQRRP